MAATWLRAVDIEDGARPGVTPAESAELREALRMIDLALGPLDLLQRGADEVGGLLQVDTRSLVDIDKVESVDQLLGVHAYLLPHRKLQLPAQRRQPIPKPVVICRSLQLVTASRSALISILSPVSQTKFDWALARRQPGTSLVTPTSRHAIKILEMP